MGEGDTVTALDEAIVRVRFAPQSQEQRSKLRMIASRPGTQEAAAALLEVAVARALCDEPAAAAGLLEVLAHVHDLLDAPVEAVTAMEQLVALVPEHVPHLLDLAKRYASVGVWQKAAETFERVGALASRDQACGALRLAARLYAANGRPERAVEAFRGVLARRPSDAEAGRAVQELLEQLERWRELAEMRGELAKRAATPIDRSRMLRAQARALERAGDTAAATEVMATAARFMTDDTSGLLDYADVLARTGKGREAAELLGKRVAEAKTRRAPPDEIAALRARHAELLEEVCEDRAAAAAVLEQLLAEHPRYVPALERAVLRAARDPDPSAHARALERYAAALDEPAAQAAMYTEAGRRHREAHDGEAAIRCFEQALALVPDASDVRDELAEARAAIDVQRATAELAAGDTAAAARRLGAILDARPHDVDANLAYAELFVAAGEPLAARAHLQQVLATAPPSIARARLAPVAFRCARLVETAGDADEAHRLLHEAHLLDRDSLEISLALGESCIARKLWRQALLYLAPLADHPDAPRFAARVAAGLAMAGLAEVRALRPAKALAHYEAAVRLDPACGAAWRALGADALERGDVDRAVECLEREAAAATAPAERARLYDALGDLARDRLGDSARAERFWRAAGSAGDAAVLRKLLAVQRARGADGERAETCLQLAALAPDDHAVLTREAAELFAAAGDFVHARTAAEQLITAHPLDIDAVNCASAIVLAACDADTAAAWLQRALAGWANERSRELRLVELWRRLGDAERSRDRAAEAKTAYERAIAIAPASPDAVAAHRALLDLAPRSQRRLESLEVVVEAEQAPADVIELARAYAAADRIADARAMFDLAGALAIPLAPEDNELLAQTMPRLLAYDEGYGSVLDAAARGDAIDDASDRGLGQLLDALGEALPLLVPDPASALRRAGITDATRLAVTSGAAVAVMYPQISKALGGPATLLFASEAVADLRVILASPPVTVFGPELAQLRGNAIDSQSDSQLRFELGRAVELARARRVLALGEPGALEALLDGLADAKRFAVLPLPLRRRVADLLAATPRDSLDLPGYRAACHRAADRSGLLASGDPAAAIAAHPLAAAHLVRFAASRAYRRALRAMRARSDAATVPRLAKLSGPGRTGR